MTSDIVREVRQYICDNFIYRDEDASLSESVSLVESGIIDSMGVLGLVTFLEDQYEVRIPDEDVTPENLDSIQRIAAYIHGRCGDASACENESHES